MPIVNLKNGSKAEVLIDELEEFLCKHREEIQPIKVKRRGAVRSDFR